MTTESTSMRTGHACVPAALSMCLSGTWAQQRCLWCGCHLRDPTEREEEERRTRDMHMYMYNALLDAILKFRPCPSKGAASQGMPPCIWDARTTAVRAASQGH